MFVYFQLLSHFRNVKLMLCKKNKGQNMQFIHWPLEAHPEILVIRHRHRYLKKKITNKMPEFNSLKLISIINCRG